MAGAGPPAPETPPPGAEAAGGQPSTGTEPQTPEQQIAAQAEQAAAPEQGQLEGDAEEGLDVLVEQADLAAQAEYLREAPPAPGQPPETAQAPTPEMGAGAYRAQAEAAAATQQVQIQRIREMPSDQFGALLQQSTQVEQQLREMAMTSSRLTEAQRNQLIGEWTQARSELNTLQTIASERSVNKGGLDAIGEARQRERQRAERIADLQTKSVDDLKTKSESSQSVARVLEQRLRDEEAKPRNEKDPNTIKALRDELHEARGEASEVQTILEEKTQKQEAETTQKEQQEKAEELEKLRREGATPEELRTAIGGSRGEISKLDKGIEDLDKKIAKEGDQQRRQELESQRAELVSQQVEIRQRLAKDEQALDEAQKKERERFTLEDQMGKDTIRKVTRQEYLQMSEEDRAKYLQELMEVTKEGTDAQINRIADKVGRGEPLSIEERAQYSRAISDEIISQGGRGGIKLESFQVLAAQYPEIAQAVFDRVTRSEAAKNTLKEKFPNNWEKMINFAKRNPVWLAILLALLVGGAATLGAAVAPAAGIGLGLGGAGSAAGGAGLFGAGGRGRR